MYDTSQVIPALLIKAAQFFLCLSMDNVLGERASHMTLNIILVENNVLHVTRHHTI